MRLLAFRTSARAVAQETHDYTGLGRKCNRRVAPPRVRGRAKVRPDRGLPIFPRLLLFSSGLLLCLSDPALLSSCASPLDTYSATFKEIVPCRCTSGKRSSVKGMKSLTSTCSSAQRMDQSA